VLEVLNSRMLEGKLLDKSLIKAMKEIEQIMNDKEIFISVFGLHNCGKSTLINALLGEE
jgi:ribosome biogenesis GTPase A